MQQLVIARYQNNILRQRDSFGALALMTKVQRSRVLFIWRNVLIDMSRGDHLPKWDEHHVERMLVPLIVRLQRLGQSKPSMKQKR